MDYIVIYSYFENDDINDFFVDSYVVFTNLQVLEKFLKNLLIKHPNANVRIYKSIELELKEVYEY